ncbi:MoaD/ThiS family protein [Methanobrevibacter sp.]
MFDDLSVSSQTIVAKQNGEIAVGESVINDGDTIQLIQIIYGG